MEAKTPKGEEMKQRIIQSAQKLFSQKGFEATSIREIVGDAGCAKGTFYLYFETKMDLFYEWTKAFAMQFDNLVAKMLLPISEDPFLQISNFLDIFINRMVEQEGNLRLFHSNEFMQLVIDEHISVEFMDNVMSHLEMFLQEGVKKGFFREMDCNLYSKMLFDMCHGMLESAVLINYPSDIQTVRNELLVMIRKVIEK